MARNKTLELAQHFGIGPFAKRSRTNSAPPVEDAPEKPSRRTGTLPNAPLEILFTEILGSNSHYLEGDRVLSNSESKHFKPLKYLGSSLSTQMRKASSIQKMPLPPGTFAVVGMGSELLKSFLGVPEPLQEDIKKYLKLREKTPFAFRFQRGGMCYQVQFADAFGDTHPDLNKVNFHLSSQQPGNRYLKDHMPMRRAEAQFAIDVIAASLTIDQHEKYAATLQRLRDHLPTPEDDLRNEQIEKSAQDSGRILKYITFEDDLYDKNEFIDKLNTIFAEPQPDRFKFIFQFNKLTP